jgi:predicted Zn finger-like uncharacterized protein
MEVRCEKCQARYRVDDARIGPQGLTMRCGKCQNTFRVMRSATTAEGAAMPAKPAPAPPGRSAAQTTMMFAAPASGAPAPTPVAKPPTPPAPPAQAPVAKPARPVPAADEAAGRTMMFQTGNLKKAPVAPKKTVPPASSTVVFSQPAARPPAQSPAGPGAPVAPAQPGPPASAKPAAGDARSTLMFGPPRAAPGSPPAIAVPPAATQPTLSEGEVEPVPTLPGMPFELGHSADGAGEEAESAGPTQVPPGAEPTEEVGESEADEAAPEPGTFDKAPPRGLLIGVAAGLALLLVIGGGLVAYRKLARRPPPPAAVEALATAQADADKDTLASIASAESKARDAAEVAGPRARFPEATAALALVEIQWADAFNDQAAQLADRSGDDTRAAQLQAQAKGKLKSAFDRLAPALKANKDSPDLQLAFADYYRAQRLPSSMNRYLANVKDDPRAALILGMAAAQEEDGAPKAIPLLKAALATSPRSARVSYRLAVAHLAAKDEAAARADLRETLRLSPQHERAKALLEQIGPASTAGQK